jgi:type I restriction enzyme M protein
MEVIGTAVTNNSRLTTARKKRLQTERAVRDEAAEPLIKRRVCQGGEWLTEYEPDPELRDTESIPLLEPGGIAGFIEREVLPHVSDAWVDESSIRIGYEISFTRNFYKPNPLRGLEAENEGLLDEVLVWIEPEAPAGR